MFTFHRQMTTQIPIGSCVLVLGICLGLDSVSANALFYRPHSEGIGKVLFSQMSVCPHLVGGYPIWLTGRYPYLPDGGYPHPSRQGGYPHPRSGQGVHHPRSGQEVPLSQVRMGGGGTAFPQSKSGPRSGWRGTLTGTTQHVLATRWAVCFLRSRRRTFLLVLHFVVIM